ncbi:hypothetical protein [Halomontanus rarus]|nr:hypothetical protein [Halovivax sp. TS33]
MYDDETDVDEDQYIDPAAETCYHLVDQPDAGRSFELDLHANSRTSAR